MAEENQAAMNEKETPKTETTEEAKTAETPSEEKPVRSEAPKAAEAPDPIAEAQAKAAESYKSPYDVGPRPRDTDPAYKDWVKRVKKARRILRTDLKDRGITKKADFEQIAYEMGLYYNDKKRKYFIWWFRFWDWVKSRFGLKMILLAAALLTLALFLWSYVTDQAGAFTVNLTTDMMRSGFVLSETSDFARTASRLFCDKCEEITNITLDDIPGTVDQYDGSHNGRNYFAYTFYIKNEGDKEGSYQYQLKLTDSTLNVEKAVWIMLYEDGHQIIYAAPAENGKAEGLFGYYKPPFYDEAYYEEQYFQEDGHWGVTSTSYVDEGLVVQGLVKGVKPLDFHKYTLVLWLEGNDPDCVNEIFGGFAKYTMDFNIIDEEEKNLFSGVWRTEYTDYMMGRYQKEQQQAEETQQEQTQDVAGNQQEVGDKDAK